MTIPNEQLPELCVIDVAFRRADATAIPARAKDSRGVEVSNIHVNQAVLAGQSEVSLACLQTAAS